MVKHGTTDLEFGAENVTEGASGIWLVGALMTRNQAFRFRKNHLTVVLSLTLFLVAACEIDDGSLDGDGTASTAQTVSPSDSDGEDAQIIEFSTWAEDAFEQDAYLEAVDLFTSETGVEVDLDMTVNEIALEQLGQ